MFNKRVILLTAWMAACMYFPALATVSPVVKPLIDKVPVKAVSSDIVSLPVAYHDGRKCDGAVCDLQARPATVQYVQRPRVFAEGFWCRGPVRRLISAPIRWLCRRC